MLMNAHIWSMGAALCRHWPVLSPNCREDKQAIVGQDTGPSIRNSLKDRAPSFARDAVATVRHILGWGFERNCSWLLKNSYS